MEFFSRKDLYFATLTLSKDHDYIDVRVYYNGAFVELEDVPNFLYKAILDCSASIQKHRGKQDMEVMIMKKGKTH